MPGREREGQEDDKVNMLGNVYRHYGIDKARVRAELVDDECDVCGAPIEDTGCEAYVMDGGKVTEALVFLCDDCWSAHCVQFDEPQPFMLPERERRAGPPAK
jgi:hypothetical protein